MKDIGEYDVRRGGDYIAEVVGPHFTVVVNLEERTCTCKMWQISGMPCVHVTAFVSRVRGLDVIDFVDTYFSIEKFRATYADTVKPMSSKDMWEKVDLPFIVGPPKTIRPRGRPKKKRIRDPNEKKRRHKYTRCKGFGHHRSSCKNPIAELSVHSASIEREGQSNTSRHPQVSDVGTPNPPVRNEEFSSQASIGSTGRMEGQPQRARRGNFQDRRL
ncbi:hypothetical protein QJS10_CPA06g00735 [Acorus calamus]|uniref:SWIM-type domain-containing protein n=1 Tax=Acorus calamus TaxID=4465 RepID=A0AAV9EKZ9_ACOCL|nr:hypothetical protein QJS10_CPA06g00735 [Acorus calamus]